MSEQKLDRLTGTLILCGLAYFALIGWLFYEVMR